MCLAMLKRLQAGRLPVNLTDPDDVRCAHAMHEAGTLAVLFIRPAECAIPVLQARPRVARVLAITPQGRALLAQALQADAEEPVSAHAELAAR